MAARVVSPTGRGFLLLDAHPTGCFRSVADMVAQIPPPARLPEHRPVALVIGSSAGYGLAATLAGLRRHGIHGVGVAFERPPGRRTGTAGWYRTIATDAVAAEAGSDFTFVNADAFADTTKAEVLDLIEKRFGQLDFLVYSVAAPRRTDPRTGTTYQSVIKPIGAAHTTRTLEFDGDGTPILRDVTAQPADEAEAADTVQVMGGEDWSRWVADLQERNLLRTGFRTVALSYIGSSLTSAIYRDGTIGAAKVHLERTARELDERLAAVDGRALTSVNGAAVTQASTAIPGIALYVSLLHATLGDALQSPVEQSVRLWDQLTGAVPFDLDEQGRLRLDRWELDPAVQAAVAERWRAITPETIAEVADVDWFRAQFRGLYGFDVPGVDYAEPVDPDLEWPAPR
ncbi:trans-2-enoyl-CoA reductase family protein [Dactylosporangium siamense]|uniref:trans-2-enoyl-CoA reductase (NAD(+)) n=1 Tax=Dactylosporangium siamense TaxID=685454 RepID=A0A919PUW6_9ACTN|nr:trans-2-enoyl-CoA reductase family protein [Dactylosporangium siamense]GIG49731.1 enoyl-[acyl-carrier-protein] reductase [NADH] [Dactylosporangium siamense]